MTIHQIVIANMVFVALLITIAWLYIANKRHRHQLDKAVEDAKDSRQMALLSAAKVAEVSGLNMQEIQEMILDQSRSAHLFSDKWQTVLPYGKWDVFDDGKDGEKVLLRGFWYDATGKIIGVKMPVGSEYEYHYHNWVEILVGLKGHIIVQIEELSGEITTKKLQPESIIKIPANMKHAVLKAETAAEFLCVWGEPKK